MRCYCVAGKESGVKVNLKEVLRRSTKLISELKKKILQGQTQRTGINNATLEKTKRGYHLNVQTDAWN